MRNPIQRANTLLDYLEPGELFVALALRLYLAPIFWMAGTRKLNDMSSTIAWFGNADWGLGLPLPAVLAWLATLTEVLGALLLLIGLGVRWVSIPLMVTMLVAGLVVHWQKRMAGNRQRIRAFCDRAYDRSHRTAGAGQKHSSRTRQH